MRISCSTLKFLLSIFLLFSFLLPFEVRRPGHHIVRKASFAELPEFEWLAGYELNTTTLPIILSILLLAINFLPEHKRINQARIAISVILIGFISMIYFEIVFEWNSKLLLNADYGFYLFSFLSLGSLLIHWACHPKRKSI